MRAFAALHLMVNDVGIGIGVNLLKTNTAQFATMLAVNLRSHFLTMGYAVPEMAKAGGGAMVNVSSLAALRSKSKDSCEATTAARLGLSRSAAVFARATRSASTRSCWADRFVDGATTDQRSRERFARESRCAAWERRGGSQTRSSFYCPTRRPI